MEKNQNYYSALLRREAQGDTLGAEERTDLELYKKKMDKADNEPHNLSRSRTLRILSSLDAQRVLANS